MYICSLICDGMHVVDTYIYVCAVNHPLTILQVPRRDDWLYAGELLMGLKYTPDECSLASDPLIDEVVSGQLQVHIVEGAGFVDEETRKPFNTLVKWYIGKF